MIGENLSNGFIEDAAELQKLQTKYYKVHPLSKEAEETKRCAREGIAKLIRRGDSINMIVCAAQDHDIPLEDLLPEAKEAFEEAATGEDYERAGAIAKRFGFDKKDVTELVHSAFLKRHKRNASNLKTLDAFKE